MNLKTFLRAGSLAALAAALALPPVAAQAQDRREGRDRGAQIDRRSPVPISPAARAIGDQVDRAQRAGRIDNRSERRAERIERSGDRAARDAAQWGNNREARRIDRQSERAARQVERQGDRRAEQVMRGRDGDRRDWDRNDRNWNDRDRDRTWRGDDGRRGNYNSRNDDRGRDYRQAQRRWDRNWRQDNRYDWNGYRQTNRRLYSPGRYASPYRNYSYRRLGIGFSLDSLFFGSRYWINDPWQYRLPVTDGPYRWVRYYDDVLLVDTYSGQVVDVIYDFFW
jgi:hypothetical protein